MVLPSICFLVPSPLAFELICIGENDLRELEKHVNFSLVSATFDETVHHVHHPCGALSARCALPTRLMFIELLIKKM